LPSRSELNAIAFPEGETTGMKSLAEFSVSGPCPAPVPAIVKISLSPSRSEENTRLPSGT